MTYISDYTLPQELLEEISEQGFDVLPQLITTVINTAMRLERQKYLQAEPYQRCESRVDYANGYKPKTVATRVGKLTFDVPQVREGDFSPSALEKGTRSERALKVALAEMYIQGVSTRKVAAITEQLCGFDKSVPPRLNSMNSSMPGESDPWGRFGISILMHDTKKCDKTALSKTLLCLLPPVSILKENARC